MALATVRLRIDRQANDADPVYWSWAVDGWDDGTSDNEALRDATLQGVDEGVGNIMAGYLAQSNIDLVEIFPGEGGPAVFVEQLSTPQPLGTSPNSPHVIQCAVNELIDTPRGVAVGGRMFVGPLSATAYSSVIGNGAKDECARIMQEVAGAQIAAGFTPVVISRYLNKAKRANPVGLPIVGFRADNRLDVLKSRRIDPSAQAEDYPLIYEA